MNIKQLLQDDADIKAAIGKVKKEGRTLGALKEPTDEQKARLAAILATDLTALEDKADVIAEQLAIARRLQDTERTSGDPAFIAQLQTGVDHATEKPWGPQVAADAPLHVKAEARHAALGVFAMAVRAAYSGGGTDPRLMAAATGAGTQVDSTLGFAVPREVAPGIERNMFESGKILSRVDARSISGNSIAYNMFTETSRADGQHVQAGADGNEAPQGRRAGRDDR
jgi:HK97 family phage major capsid protein